MAEIRQERPSNVKSNVVHPAFRERGSAIPKPTGIPRSGSPRIVEGRVRLINVKV